MASFTKRTYTSWRVRSVTDPSITQAFDAQAPALEHQRLLAAQGITTKVTSFKSQGWQVRVRRKGFPPQVKTFARKDQAEQWAVEREGEISKRQFVDHREADRHTLGDLLDRFDKTRLQNKPRHDPDRSRVRTLRGAAMAGVRMSQLRPKAIADYRDERLKQVKGATVTKELELIRRVIGIARLEWDIQLYDNPASGRLVKRPAPQEGDARDRRLQLVHTPATEGSEATSRHLAGDGCQVGPGASKDPSVANRGSKGGPRRRLRPDVEFEDDPASDWFRDAPQSEQQALLRACRYPHWYRQRKAEVTKATQKARLERAQAAPPKARLRPGLRVWAFVSLAIEIAMRRGELVKLEWSHVRLDAGYLDLPGHITKNGKPRIVPLTLRALRILRTQPRTGSKVFDTTANAVKMAFERARRRANCEGLRLHDLRHEATSRLFERTTLRDSEIGDITGHTDPRMLQRYYNKRPAEIVERFRRSFRQT